MTAHIASHEHSRTTQIIASHGKVYNAYAYYGKGCSIYIYKGTCNSRPYTTNPYEPRRTIISKTIKKIQYFVPAIFYNVPLR